MNYLLSILLTSIIEVESGEGLGSTDIDSVGGDGRAVGMLHITPAMVMDVNLITGKHYKLADRLDRMASIEMYTVYLTHYGNVYGKRTVQRSGKAHRAAPDTRGICAYMERRTRWL